MGTMEAHLKRHRGPMAVRPLASVLARTARHLPHWAQRVNRAVDRLVFETTIETLPSDPPPGNAGDREPRRPRPTAPSAAQALDEPRRG